MEIKGTDYKMEKLVDVPFYNLSRLVTINKGTDKERQEYKVVGYGMPFKSCIERVVSSKLDELEGTYSVKEYLEVYKEAVQKLFKDFG